MIRMLHTLSASPHFILPTLEHRSGYLHLEINESGHTGSKWQSSIRAISASCPSPRSSHLDMLPLLSKVKDIRNAPRLLVAS